MPSWWPRATRPSDRLVLRLAAVVLATVLVLLGSQWLRFSAITSDVVVAAHAAEHRALADELTGLPAVEVGATLDVVVTSPRVLAAVVLGTGMEQEPAHGRRDVVRDPSVAPVAAAGARAAGPVDLRGGERGYAFLEPMAQGRRLLVVERDIVGDLAPRLRSGLAVVTLVTLLAALPLAWLLGGRRLVAATRHLEDQRHVDGLTGLPDHRAFITAVPRLVDDAAAASTELSLLLVGMDRFGSFDEAVGHAEADRVLAQCAVRLRAIAPPRGVFRVGGDQFALLLPVGGAEAVAAAEALRAWHEHGSPVTVSVGVASVADTDGGEGELQLAGRAALAQAKRTGRNRVCRYAEMGAATLLPTPRRRAALRDLVEGGEIGVAWQPIVRGDGEIHGFEALARPVSDDPELRNPGTAFELADLLGATVELDAACRRAILRRAGEVGTARLFLNVSPLALAGGALDVDRLLADLVAAGLSPRQLVVELTEREIVEPEALLGPVHALRAAGIRVALDDLGSGNAGLGVLRVVPVDVVKIDRSLIVDAAAGVERAAAVVVAIGALARDLGVEVLAEGVETPEEVALGLRVGTLLQGFGIARPAASPADAIAHVRRPDRAAGGRGRR